MISTQDQEINKHLDKSKIKTTKKIKITKHKSKFREEKRRKEKRDAQPRSRLNRRANPKWNPCKSSLQLTLSPSNLNPSLTNEIKERKWNDGMMVFCCCENDLIYRKT